MHILVAHPGLHHVHRGSEIAFEQIGQAIAAMGRHSVTLAGSGHCRSDRAYRFQHLPAVRRELFEKWPKMPYLRSEFMYEELTFAISLLSSGLRNDADVTVCCSYPYTSWALRSRTFGRSRTPHVFVTQNGDWPASVARGEPAFFACDGLICTNPLYYERNKDRWRSALIPNGVDASRFRPGPSKKAELGLPEDRPIALMVSALQRNKRILEAIRAVAVVKDVHLVLAGDGILRSEVDSLARELIPDRFTRRTFTYEQMPDVYRSADVFLHTAIGESFGNVYIEALSCGRPVIAHDDTITRWILGERGILVDTNIQAELTGALKGAVSSSSRDAESSAMWAHERYSWSTIASYYEEFISSVARN